MSLVNWQYCKNLNDIDNAIIYGNEDWKGLTSADDIISITYNPNHGCYVVLWRVKQKTSHEEITDLEVEDFFEEARTCGESRERSK